MKSGPFTLVGTSLTGKTIGIMGLGRIGFATAKRFKALDTGKSFSEALILASTNPQYDKRLFIELGVHYMKIPSSEHVKNMLCT